MDAMVRVTDTFRCVYPHAYLVEDGDAIVGSRTVREGLRALPDAAEEACNPLSLLHPVRLRVSTNPTAEALRPFGRRPRSSGRAPRTR